MERPNIGLVGAGALGSRHLQALMITNRALNIYVMDTSEESLRKSEELCYQMRESSNHKIIFTTDVNKLPKKLEVVIVATSANVRKIVIEQIIANSKVNYFILEKVLFQKIEDYRTVHKMFEENNIKSWVNCPRRLYPFYQELKERLSNATSMEISVSGSAWGLGCNGIHFMDLIAFLAGNEMVKVDISGLEKEYLQSKRLGFLEIAGTISGTMGRCKNYSITSYLGQTCPISIQITSDVLKCVISESKKTALIAEESNEWEWKEEIFQLPYQSQLTQVVLQDILDTGECKLTDYDTSRYLHENLQEALIPYFTKLGVEGNQCPIT